MKIKIWTICKTYHEQGVQISLLFFPTFSLCTQFYLILKLYAVKRFYGPFYYYQTRKFYNI